MNPFKWDLADPRQRLWAIGFVFALHLASIFLLTPVPISADAEAYNEIAHSLVEYGTYAYKGEPKVDLMPAYPLLLATVYRIAGPLPVAVHVVQAAMLALAAWITFLAARLFAGQHAGKIAFWLLSLLPVFFIYPTTLNAEIYVLVIVAFILWVLARMKEHPTQSNAALFGGAIGLLCLAKPEFTVWLLGAPLLLFGAKLPLRRIAIYSGVAGAMLILTVAPWSIRNFVTFSRFIPLSVSSGRALWITGHKPALFDYGGAEFKAALAQCDVPGDPKATDDCLRVQATAMIHEHPAYYLVGCVKRLVAFFIGSHTEYLTGFSDSFGAAMSSHSYGVFAIKLFLLVIHSAFAVGGLLAVLWIGRNREWLFLPFMVLIKVAVHVVIFATPRYNLHLAPIFALCWAAVIVRMRERTQVA